MMAKRKEERNKKNQVLAGRVKENSDGKDLHFRAALQAKEALGVIATIF